MTDRPLRRVGDPEKCPACSASMDAEAYRCPKCFVYFCFKCRRRVQKGDPQYQCLNQQCNQYGKLLCNICVIVVPHMGEQTNPLPIDPGGEVGIVSEDVQGLAFLAITGIGFAIFCWYFDFSWWVSLLIGLILGGSLVGWLSSLKRFKEPVYQNITETVEVGRSKCCIVCK
jgi:hypothetical protein